MNLVPGINVGNALKQIGAYAKGNYSADYDVIDKASVRGGARSPAGGEFFGATNAPASAPAPSGGPQYSDPGGSVGYTDPHAAYGGTAAFNSLRQGFGNQKSNIYGTANDAASSLGGRLGSSVQDIIHGLTTGQQSIDQRGVQNESAKLQGVQGILGMVGRGIRSGGVMLANKNAGNSSAAGALASAYGDQGRRELSKVGNQYEAGKADIARAQGEQDYQLARAPERFNTELMGNVNNIVNEARNQFAQLDAAMANASLPDRIAIDQEKEAVRQQVLSKLQQYDSQLRQGVGGIRAAGGDQLRSQARQMNVAGVAPEDSFDYDELAPAEFRGSGPFASTLPIFSYRGKTEQMA